ncbi:MAG: pantoate--beta-alanine ligase [Nitrospinales bacterium]
MEIIHSIDEMRARSRQARDAGKVVGFVPTMGCLHEGHLSLVRHSLAACDFTVVGIFINPAQFGENEDLETYPVDLESDRRNLDALGVDALFLPSRREIYPDGYKTFVCVEEISARLCGKSRPGFFRGVATVVLKLFNIVQPHTAFFGEKDRQQLGVIQTMVRDLNLPVSVVGLPIVREPDGLAMSSRNLYLSPEQRPSALALHKALQAAAGLVKNGETSADKIKKTMRRIIDGEKHAEIDYISVCDTQTFTDKEHIDGEALIALAVRVGKARLIDNCVVERNGCNESC